MFKDTDDNVVPYHYFGFCYSECRATYDEDNNIDTVEQHIKDSKILIFEEQRSNMARFFTQPPCTNCPYKSHEYKYIYDIAFGREGMWTLAVEIRHTRPANKEKILDTPFPIFEIDADWVLKQTKIPEFLKGEWL